MRARQLRGLLLVSALAGLCGVGCTSTSTCSRNQDMVTVPLAAGLVEGNTYHSAPYGGPYVYFPANRTVVFEHGLGAIPYSVQFWLAFTATGSLAPSARNATELRGPEGNTDPAITDTQIMVFNDTCADYYLWVVAMRYSP